MATPTPACGQNCVYDNITNHWYYLNSDLQVEWAQAKQHCENLGMSLIIIDSSQKLQFVNKITQNLDVWFWVY